MKYEIRHKNVKDSTRTAAAKSGCLQIFNFADKRLPLL